MGGGAGFLSVAGEVRVRDLGGRRLGGCPVPSPVAGEGQGEGLDGGRQATSSCNSE